MLHSGKCPQIPEKCLSFSCRAPFRVGISALEYIMWWSVLLQEALTKEKEELEARMKEELEDQLQVKEATLMEYLEHQRQTLLKEKLEVEEKLQKELETAREHDFKKMAEELELQKQNLEKVMIALVPRF